MPWYIKRQRIVGNAVLQDLPVEKFHRNDWPTVVFANFIDGADVRVIQGRSSLCLKVEASQYFCVWREPVREELQGNEAVELGILCFIDNAHTAPAELFGDAVVRDGLANHSQRRRNPRFHPQPSQRVEGIRRRDVVGGGIILAHLRQNRAMRFCKLLKTIKIWRMSL